MFQLPSPYLPAKIFSLVSIPAYEHTSCIKLSWRSPILRFTPQYAHTFDMKDGWHSSYSPCYRFPLSFNFGLYELHDDFFFLVLISYLSYLDGAAAAQLFGKGFRKHLSKESVWPLVLNCLSSLLQSQTYFIIRGLTAGKGPNCSIVCYSLLCTVILKGHLSATLLRTKICLPAISANENGNARQHIQSQAFSACLVMHNRKALRSTSFKRRGRMGAAHGPSVHHILKGQV